MTRDTDKFTISDDPDVAEQYCASSKRSSSNDQDEYDEDDMVHDLPNIEEYKTSQMMNGTMGSSSMTGGSMLTMSAVRGAKNARRRFQALVLVLCLLLVVLSVTLIVSAASKRLKARDTGNSISNNPNGPNGDNGYYNNQRDNDGASNVQKMQRLAISEGWSSVDSFRDPNSPQSKAAFFIATMDPLQVPFSTASNQLLQRYVLSVLYYSTGGDNWKDSINFLSERDECGWDIKKQPDNENDFIELGIICDERDFITHILLPSNGLRGTLPVELRLLGGTLQELNLYNNDLSGSIPKVYSQLAALRSFVLHQNNIRDTFPAWVPYLESLETMSIGNNDITGPLPKSIGSSTSLKVIACESCYLNETLQPLLNMKSLLSIRLGSNQITGALTDTLFDSWPDLIELDVGRNRLKSNLPKRLLTSKTLMVADLHENNFTGGVITDDIIMDDVLESPLRVLALHSNQLTGPIHPWVDLLNDLRHLDLSFNQFNGTIPTELGNLKELRYLYLAGNDFEEGEIPTELGLLTNLLDLSLQNTRRNGTIPKEFDYLKQLILLDLSFNKLSSFIPAEVGDLPNLRYLLLRDNRFNGALPDTFKELETLDVLLLDNNLNITSMPEDLCNKQYVKELRIFNIDCNDFTDGYDCSVSKCCECCDKLDANSDVESTCKIEAFFSNIDPVAEYHYVRQYYRLFEDDKVTAVAPRPDNENPLWNDTNSNNVSDWEEVSTIPDENDTVLDLPGDAYSPDNTEYNANPEWKEQLQDAYNDDLNGPYYPDDQVNANERMPDFVKPPDMSDNVIDPFPMPGQEPNP